MTSRELNPAERMVDAFDRANTLSFTIVVTMRGALTHAEIEHALRKLESRHPLLRAQVVREDNSIVFSRGEGAHIPLIVEQGDGARLRDLAAKSIEHRAWPDAGPRAELTWLRHDDNASSLLLCLHHLVSDGSSGVIAMRDLLAFIAEPDVVVEALESPGQHAYLSPKDLGFAARGRALLMVTKAMVGPKPQRLRAANCAPSQRQAQLIHVALSDVETARLLARARRDGATAHGVVCAALGLAIATEHGGAMQQRVTHPVDLRRYLRSRDADSRAIGNDRMGYYVSSVDTDHKLTPSTSLSSLTSEITAAVRRKKQLGEPLLTGPMAGPMAVAATRSMSPERFCRFAERDLLLSTFSVTNLGPLENLGLHAQVGRLTLEDAWFLAAGSVLSALGAAVTTFGGRLHMSITGAAPLIAPTVFERVAQRVDEHLKRYANDH